MGQSLGGEPQFVGAAAEQLHPSRNLREAARTAMKTCLRCGFLHMATLACPQCEPEEQGVSWQCGSCGFETDHQPERCPRCEEQQAAFREERRRGIIDTEAPEEILQAIGLLHQAERVIFEALVRVPRREDAIDLAEIMGELRGICIDLERG